MKYEFLFVSLFCIFSFAASAESPVESAVLFSAQKNQGSMWTSVKSAHFKSFDALLLSGGKRDINLEKICCKAYDPKGETQKLDSIDERLITVILKSCDSISGFYQFASEGEGVYRATVVGALLDCKWYSISLYITSFKSFLWGELSLPFSLLVDCNVFSGNQT